MKIQIIIICLLFSLKTIGQNQDLLVCEQLLEEYASSFKATDYKTYPYFCYNEYIPSTRINLSKYFRCLVTLANNGNKQAEKYFLEHSLDVFYLDIEGKKSYFYTSCFPGFLEDLNPSEQAFETILIFFKENKLAFESNLNHRTDKTGHTHPNTHYGMKIYYRILFFMIEKEQQEFYKNELGKLFIEYVAKYGEDSEESFGKHYHPIWYKRIKEDWDAGKIKLRTEK